MLWVYSHKEEKNFGSKEFFGRNFLKLADFSPKKKISSSAKIKKFYGISVWFNRSLDYAREEIFEYCAFFVEKLV